MLLAFSAFPQVGAADDVIEPKVLVRKFPQGQFCALPISMTFIAPFEAVIVTFTALQWVDDGSGSLQWTEQLIDNVSVAPTAQVAANTLPPPAGSESENCYIGDPTPTPYFRFNVPGLDLRLLQRFDADPSATWLMTDGAYFTTSRTAARDVGTVTDFTGGALGLGDGAGTPAAGSTASTSVVLDNLELGTSYDLGAWWYAGFVRFPHDTDYLTVTITTLGGVPVAKRSWGAVKRDFR
jgi:hypothetical protein